VLDSVLFPAMAKVQDDSRRLGAAYLRGVALMALLVLPLSAALILLAPEVIRLALGPRWMPAVATFQILGIGMLFRTSYKVSDSIARSTGAVYRRAWRQILYAGLVVVGAWIGQHWGIEGVACGVVVALTFNFLAMAELGLGVAQVSWGAFWGVHLPALWLTLVSFPAVWAATHVARGLALPAVLVLCAGGAMLLAVCTGLCWRFPSVFLGRDGEWMLHTLGSLARKILRRPVVRMPVPQRAGTPLAVTDAGDAG
jgi:O-antigen/teichoic acid export membrane protein